MRTSLIETAQIDQLVQKQGDPGERLLMEARIQVNDELSEKVNFQVMAYNIIHEYGRRKLRKEIAQIDKQLFTSRKHLDFRNKILSYFIK
ncbi:hypothetical protein [Reichenbachiella sp. MALMAid0571]|uniref:hypothetical protein n=1 Tax=Reichenbachiella sp. MALMAid0571 TaxID=3143939 RepID=UPI0032DF2495